MAKTFRVSVLTPDRVLFDGDVEYLYVPGAAGYMGILPDHAPLLSSLTPGKFELRLPPPAASFAFNTQKSGFLEVNKNIVSILLDVTDSSAISA